MGSPRDHLRDRIGGGSSGHAPVAVPASYASFSSYSYPPSVEEGGRRKQRRGRGSLRAWTPLGAAAVGVVVFVGLMAGIASDGSMPGGRLPLPSRMLALAGFYSPPSSAPSPLAPAPRDLTIRATNEDYKEPVYISSYPWDLVAEPFRTTVFEVEEPLEEGHSLEWTLTFQAGGSRKEALHVQYRGSTLEALLTDPGSVGLIEVVEVDEGGLVAGNGKASVACKYVRREIRELTKKDREVFLDALEAVHRLGLDEGRQLHGENFANYEYFTAKHLARMTLDGYSPFHSGQSFLTSHFAFSLELELSLQSVDPTIALPYWDYTRDRVDYGSDWQRLSPIFNQDWLGAYEEGFYWTRGRWAYLPIPFSLKAPERNAYGRVTDSINADASGFVGRSSSMCGLETQALLPGCTEVQGALKAPDLQQFHSRVEFGLHGMLHGAVGGFWDCPLSMGELARERPEWTPVLEAIALQANTLWRSAAIRKRLTICQLGPCEADEQCACMNPELDALPEGHLPYEKALDLLQGASIIDMLAANPWLDGFIQVEGLDPHNKVPGQPIDFTFVLGSEEENRELIVWLTRFLAHPPKLSSFATPLAAPNDPLFGPSHSSWLRAWDARVLSSSGDGANDGEGGTPLDMTWTSASETWYGHNLYDALPFRGFEPGEPDPDHFYSNAELLNMMNPRNPGLPYVHNTLQWAHCENSE
jgi:hypothetical protein